MKSILNPAMIAGFLVIAFSMMSSLKRRKFKWINDVNSCWIESDYPHNPRYFKRVQVAIGEMVVL
ncbi:hypothetical protein [Peribacillus muralis]|uniref:hypothetical protein n=1 Tax=Peribacillus muralis TaxID=264697 RepID=UPI00366D194A